MKVTLRISTEDLAEACYAHFIETGRPATIKELAAELGCSESTVRKRMFDCGHVPPGCIFDDIEVPVYSLNYPGTVMRHRMVDAWAPSRATLRARILNLTR